MRLAFLLLLPLILAACDGGPVGLVDVESGVRAEATSRGIVVENTKEEPIYAVAYGEAAMRTVDPPRPSLDAPGRGIGSGEGTTFAYGGRVLASDGYYRVYWITIKGEGGDRHIGERGTLELAR